MRLGISGRAADKRAYACHQLLHPEWLWQIVVGASIDAVNAFAPASARGEHDDRGRQSFLAPMLEHAHAIHPRQADIEDDRSVRLGRPGKPGLLAIVQNLRNETLRL